MKHTIKRILSIAFCAFLILSLLPATVPAETQTVTVHCRAPESWEQCYIYWWGFNTDPVYWPGVHMSQTESGIWHYDIPANVEGLLFNDGTGNQTVDLQLPYGDVYMYDIPSNQWVGTPPPPDEDAYYVAGDSGLCVVEWVPDARLNQMTAVDDHTYSKSYTDVPAGSYELKVTDGTWSNCWGANGGDQSYLVVVDDSGSNITIYFDSQTKEIRHTVEVPKPVIKRKLKVFAPDTWQNVFAYTWNPDSFGQWPGTPLTQEGEAFVAEVPVSMSNLVLSSQIDDGLFWKTADIQLENNGRDVAIYIDEDFTCYVEYGIVPDFVFPYSLALVGEGIPGISQWNPADPAGDMSPVSEGSGLYSKVLDCPAGTTMAFKIVGNDTWDETWVFGGGAIQLGQEIQLERGFDGQDMRLEITEACQLRFTVNLEPLRDHGNATLLVEKLLPVTTRKLKVFAPDTWLNVFAYTWDPESLGQWPGTPLTQEGEAFVAEVPVSMTNLVLSSQMDDGIRRQTADIQLENNGRDVAIYIDEDFTCYVEYGIVPDFVFPYSLALVGEGIPGISQWNPADPAGDMSPVSEGSGLYSKVLDCPAGTTMAFKIVGNDTWDETWVFGGGAIQLGQEIQLERGFDGQDMRLEITEACQLRFTVNLEPLRDHGNATLLVEKLLPVSTRKLTVVAPEYWRNTYAYTWDPKIYDDFPGVRMENRSHFYEMMVPSDMRNLIITGYTERDTIQQTSDIYLEDNGENVIVFIYEDGSHSLCYGNLYRVTGNTDWMGLWNPASNVALMDEVTPGVFQKHFEDVVPGSYLFKITKDGRWDDAYGEADGSDFSFTVWETCDVTVTLMRSDGKVTVALDEILLCKGDVTGDGKLNMGDVAKLYGHIRGNGLLTAAGALSNGDFNGDGKHNMGDTAALYGQLRNPEKASVEKPA